MRLLAVACIHLVRAIESKDGISPAGLADVCGYWFVDVTHFKWLSDGGIVFLTEWDNIPAVIIGDVLLDMGTDQLLFKASLRRTISWNCLTGELLPVIEPASAFACALTSAVDVSNSHVFPPLDGVSQRSYFWHIRRNPHFMLFATCQCCKNT